MGVEGGSEVGAVVLWSDGSKSWEINETVRVLSKLNAAVCLHVDTSSRWTKGHTSVISVLYTPMLTVNLVWNLFDVFFQSGNADKSQSAEPFLKVYVN